MKKLLILAIFCIVFQNSYSQTEKQISSENESSYNSGGVEVKPEFPGGIKEFYNFIAKNYKVPDVAGLKGKLLIMFIIDKDGSLTNIEVKKDLGFGTGNEAVRILKLSPKWIPARQNGQNVRCSYLIPINIETVK
ncbi:MAG: energy transducer TonB [Flavobacterium sp.]|nr:energy transducer TonB [Flavobacterium sp.]